MTPQLQAELWTSWASMLRVYAAAHGLNAAEQAITEVSADTITLRVGTRWLRFTPTEMTTSEGTSQPFTLHEDGAVSLNHAVPEEMDMAAERLTRAMLAPAS
jgi:hypothetical protein